MEFRLLGRLEVRGGGRELPLGGGKQRALLAMLLLHAGEVVPTERLIDALWGERAPASALNSVHIYVSQLRRALGDGQLVTRDHGYALELGNGELDLDVFERLLERGRELLASGDARAASQTLHEALGLWRGPPLVDFAYEPFAQAEIARLESLRLAALDARIESDLLIGRHAELVPELEALVRAEPLRERLHAQLMLALYRCGRQADALETYQRARRTLVEELGLEPGPELQELERAILRHDPVLAAPKREPASRRHRRTGGISIAVGGAILLGVAAAGFAFLRDSKQVVSVQPESVALVDATSDAVSAAVAVGARPSAVAVGRDAVWVANAENSVSRIDPRTRSVRQTIQVGGSPADVAVTRDAVWVANGLDGTVSRIDPDSSLVVQTIAVGNGPAGIAAGEGAVWVTNSADGTLSRIDAETGRATRTLPAAVGASGVAVGFGRLWVVSPPTGSVAVLEPRSGQVLQRIGVGADPEAVAVGSGFVWVANRTDGTISKIDPRRGAVTDTIRIGRAATGVAAGRGHIWAADAADATLSRIEPSTDAIVGTVRLGNPPQDLALSPQGVYVAVRSTGREHRGGTVRVAAMFGGPTSVDPAVSESCWCTSILTNDGLVGFRRVGGVRGTQLVPDLAVALPTVTDGGRRYTFRVRAGVRYSNGTQVQPDDFRRAIERVVAAQPGTERVTYYDGIVGADRCSSSASCDLSRGIVVDRSARTVTFRLTTQDPDFLFKLALPFAFAVPAGAPAPGAGTHPLPATGPYRVAAFDPKRHTLRLVRNRSFREWSADAQPDGYPDTISLSWRFRTTSAVVRAAERGSADIALLATLPKPELDRLATRYPTRLHLSTQPHTAYFFLNTRVPPFDDPRARIAVNDAFDRDAFARVVGRAYAPTCQILPPNLPGYRPTCPYRGGGVAGLDAARRRVEQSGTRGAPVTVWVGNWTADQGRYMVRLLDAIGYRARLKIVAAADPGVYFGKILDSRVHAQVGYFGWAAEFPSAVDMIQPMFGCAAFVEASARLTSNPSEFCDHGIDAQMERAAALQAQDPSAANVLWQRIEREILAQAPVVATSNRRSIDFVSKRVGNYEYHPQWGVLLGQLWVK